jgi:hypothetical protein
MTTLGRYVSTACAMLPIKLTVVAPIRKTRRSEPPGGQQTIAIASASEAAEHSTLRSKGRQYRRRHSETAVDAGPCR